MGFILAVVALGICFYLLQKVSGLKDDVAKLRTRVLELDVVAEANTEEIEMEGVELDVDNGIKVEGSESVDPKEKLKVLAQKSEVEIEQKEEKDYGVMFGKWLTTEWQMKLG